MPGLTASDAGALVRRRREERGLTQEQVVARTTIPSVTQLSQYETGRINIVRSKHLASVAAAVGLTEEDVRSINPAAVFDFSPAAGRHDERAAKSPDTPASVEVPYRALATLGTPDHANGPEGHLSIELKDHQSSHSLYRVDTRSMEPEIVLGAHIVVDLERTKPEPPGIYAVGTDLGVLLMRVHADVFGQLTMTATGFDHRTTNADGLKVYGRVVRYLPPRPEL